MGSRSVRRERPRFPLLGNRRVRGTVPEASGTSAGVRTQVPHEESHSSVLAPLAHVHELVREKPVVVLVTAADDDPAAEGHASNAGREDRHHEHSRSFGVLDGDVIERGELARVQASRHGATR
jgi:hypothetical protein